MLLAFIYKDTAKNGSSGFLRAGGGEGVLFILTTPRILEPKGRNEEKRLGRVLHGWRALL